MTAALALGIDFGTSGARSIVINPAAQIESAEKVGFSSAAPEPHQWRDVLHTLLDRIPVTIRQRIQSIAINGTSSTVLICDLMGQPIGPSLLYNDDRGQVMLESLQSIAPVGHTVVSATSSLVKLLWLAQSDVVQAELVADQARSLYFLHQADWLSFLLHGQLGISDYHNALKLGYDVENLRYSDWFSSLTIPFVLPTIFAPGQIISAILPSIATRFQFPSSCIVRAGTTDSIAAFLASGARSPGEAVTSLGSTLVLKLLSRSRLENSQYGIYSHRLGDLWLVGGASNTGGAVLQQFFSEADLHRLSAAIDPDQASPLDYYPLLKPGERFPLNDATLPPRLTPRPDRPVEFLHGLLESMARIEAQGYQLLQEMGASRLMQVYTAGGGAANDTWTAIRSRLLPVPVIRSAQTEAAFGTALLAQRGH